MVKYEVEFHELYRDLTYRMGKKVYEKKIMKHFARNSFVVVVVVLPNVKRAGVITTKETNFCTSKQNITFSRKFFHKCDGLK